MMYMIIIVYDKCKMRSFSENDDIFLRVRETITILQRLINGFNNKDLNTNVCLQILYEKTQHLANQTVDLHYFANACVQSF